MNIYTLNKSSGPRDIKGIRIVLLNRRGEATLMSAADGADNGRISIAFISVDENSLKFLKRELPLGSWVYALPEHLPRECVAFGDAEKTWTYSVECEGKRHGEARMISCCGDF